MPAFPAPSADRVSGMDARDRPNPPDAEPLSGWTEPIGVRVRDVGEIAAALPHLLGFRPEESVLLLGLGGASGRRVGLTVRADIPPPEHNRELATVLGRSLFTDRPEGALVLVVSEAPDEEIAGEPDLPHRDLVWELCRALSRLDVPVGDAVLVRDGRWWSYDCPDHCCAPGAGTPLPTGPTELEVASIATGRVVARDRGELQARLGPPAGADRRAMADTCAQVGVEISGAVLDSGREEVAARSWAAVSEAAARCRPGTASPPSDREVARVAWALRDVEVRDLALGLALGPDAAGAEQLWTECVRRAPAPLDAAPATLLAVCAWLRGDGAMANIALDRALASDPDHGLARLLRDALVACVPPDDLRTMLAAAAAPAAG
jgi:Domain of unknown function (DUF4192)